ncbi:hypothetical protein CSA56_15875 [candidate division KSB3 bacterium]|uniref:Uncharacterized protein n=1 Tax=candidate division KSB3 bacterium TaxID=2044937 RepID=A0A2G6K9H2_9BACT|nr:MAG: hypothetical protein CSA56_15875 [candidate division KSB3 bacterium]
MFRPLKKTVTCSEPHSVPSVMLLCFQNDEMIALTAQQYHTESSFYLTQVFQHEPQSFRRKNAPQNISREVSTKHRNAALWRLLCLEHRVEASDLMTYWEIMDDMMDLSIVSAVVLLELLYDYQVRKLKTWEKNRHYPGVSNDIYRLEYDDQPGGYRDVCASALINEAIDVLQEEAERLVRLEEHEENL